MIDNFAGEPRWTTPSHNLRLYTLTGFHLRYKHQRELLQQTDLRFGSQQQVMYLQGHSEVQQPTTTRQVCILKLNRYSGRALFARTNDQGLVRPGIRYAFEICVVPSIARVTTVDLIVLVLNEWSLRQEFVLWPTDIFVNEYLLPIETRQRTGRTMANPHRLRQQRLILDKGSAQIFLAIVSLANVIILQEFDQDP